MIPMRWPEEFNSGHHTIDQCHRQLFAHLNRLVASCEQGRGCQQALSLIHFLRNNLQQHFQVEEELMQRVRFPERPQHVRKHQEFSRTIRQLSAEIKKDAPAEDETMTAINEAVIDWVFHHICVEDRAFCAFLNDQSR